MNTKAILQGKPVTSLISGKTYEIYKRIDNSYVNRLPYVRSDNTMAGKKAFFTEVFKADDNGKEVQYSHDDYVFLEPSTAQGAPQGIPTPVFETPFVANSNPNSKFPVSIAPEKLIKGRSYEIYKRVDDSYVATIPFAGLLGTDKGIVPLFKYPPQPPTYPISKTSFKKPTVQPSFAVQYSPISHIFIEAGSKGAPQSNTGGKKTKRRRNQKRKTITRKRYF
jgi:hypothetical protein